MIVCPNTSPLLVLARLDRLDLFGEPPSVVLTRAVLAEVHEKQDEATARVDRWVTTCRAPVDPAVAAKIDPLQDLGPGERSVLRCAVSSAEPVLCVLDDAAARAEARRLSAPPRKYGDAPRSPRRRAGKARGGSVPSGT